MMNGPSDLPAYYGVMDNETGAPAKAVELSTVYWKLGGTLWQYPERYIKNSPIFDLDQVTTPVLIIHGTEDYNVPVTQGREVYTDLNLLGREVELRQYDGEGHGQRDFANAADFVYSQIKWFDDHLKK